MVLKIIKSPYHHRPFVFHADNDTVSVLGDPSSLKVNRSHVHLPQHLLIEKRYMEKDLANKFVMQISFGCFSSSDEQHHQHCSRGLELRPQIQLHCNKRSLHAPAHSKIEITNVDDEMKHKLLSHEVITRTRTRMLQNPPQSPSSVVDKEFCYNDKKCLSMSSETESSYNSFLLEDECHHTEPNPVSAPHIPLTDQIDESSYNSSLLEDECHHTEPNPVSALRIPLTDQIDEVEICKDTPQHQCVCENKPPLATLLSKKCAGIPDQIMYRTSGQCKTLLKSTDQRRRYTSDEAHNIHNEVEIVHIKDLDRVETVVKIPTHESRLLLRRGRSNNMYDQSIGEGSQSVNSTVNGTLNQSLIMTNEKVTFDSMRERSKITVAQMESVGSSTIRSNRITNSSLNGISLMPKIARNWKKIKRRRRRAMKDELKFIVKRMVPIPLKSPKRRSYNLEPSCGCLT